MMSDPEPGPDSSSHSINIMGQAPGFVIMSAKSVTNEGRPKRWNFFGFRLMRIEFGAGKMAVATDFQALDPRSQEPMDGKLVSFPSPDPYLINMGPLVN